MPAKKTTTTATKKTAAKKTVATKVPAKKVAAKKAAVSKAPAQKVATPKATAKKAATKQAGKTTIIANVDVGFGNSLYLRGEGAGLSWDQGTILENVSPYEWAFSSDTKGDVNFKFLINDEAWADGEDLTVAAGGTSVSSPVFSW
jgi:hypothetical protein